MSGRVSRSLVLALICTPAVADEPDVRLLHSQNGAEHCYRILHDGNKPVKEISVGSSWSGHPIKDSIKLTVTDKPLGWNADHEVRSRHGYQFILLTVPEYSLTAKVFPKGYLGRICLSLSADVKEMGALPYAFQLDGDSNRIVGTAVADDGRTLRLFDEQDIKKDGLENATDKIDKARKANDALKKLKDIF